MPIQGGGGVLGFWCFGAIFVIRLRVSVFLKLRTTRAVGRQQKKKRAFLNSTLAPPDPKQTAQSLEKQTNTQKKNAKNAKLLFG